MLHGTLISFVDVLSARPTQLQLEGCVRSLCSTFLLKSIRVKYQLHLHA